MTQKLIRRPEVQELTGLSTSTLYEQMKRGDFPRPLRISARAVAWRLADINTWLDALQTSLERPAA